MRVVICNEPPNQIQSDVNVYNGIDFSGITNQTVALIKPIDLGEWQPEYMKALSDDDSVLVVRNGMITQITSLKAIYIVLPKSVITTMTNDVNGPLGTKVEVVLV